MDSQEYKSITGLDNYLGFKSLLKNGSKTGVYRCDDETIVFNKIETTTQFTGLKLLEQNQVAVLLNYSSALTFIAGLLTSNTVYIWDQNFTYNMIVPNQLVFGQVFTYGIDFNTYGSTCSLTYAIFDLF